MNNNFSKYIVFMDECGVPHSGGKEDSGNFVLIAVVFKKEDYIVFNQKMLELKFDLFGHHDVVFHYNKLTGHHDEFSIFNDADRRNDFIQAYDTVVKESEFFIICAICDKAAYNKRQVKKDIYHNMLEIVMTRIYMAIKANNCESAKTFFLIESRVSSENKILSVEFKKICDGNNHLTSRNKMNFEVRFVDKKSNLSGLQLADTCVSVIGQWISGKRTFKQIVDTIIKKFRTNEKTGVIKGYGLIVHPKTSKFSDTLDTIFRNTLT